jgi:putative transposase
MPIDAKWLIYLTFLTVFLGLCARLSRQKSSVKRHPFARRKAKVLAQSHRPPRQNRKPGWVKTEVLRLLATTRGQAGCRMVAAMFNTRFAYRGESVSKTYVADLRKKCGYDLLQLRRNMRQPPKPGKPNQTWALDWTNVTIDTQMHTILGVIDHGSRRLLALCFDNKSAVSVLKIIRQLIQTFGKPHAIRTDNDGAFVSLFFALALAGLGIKHQRSPPHSPWANGRIERFFGTFKRAIRQIEISSKAQLYQAMGEFAFFYNHIRLHQNLGYRTPDMAWQGKPLFPKRKNPQWFAGWNGVLCGWYWGNVKLPADD